MSGRTLEGCLGLNNHLEDCATPIATRSAPYDHANTSNGHGSSTSKAGQMCPNWDNGLIFD